MPFEKQPLNQSDYTMKIIKDLGMVVSPSNPKRGIHKALMECSKCKKHFEVRVCSSASKKQTTCSSCTADHAMYKHPLYAIWNTIKQRCYNTKRKDYHRYGGVGVTMCDQWKDDVTAFIGWCEKHGWSSDLVIDKDIKSSQLGIVPASYSPATVSFVTPQENAEAAAGKAVDQLSLTTGELLNTYQSCTKAALALGKLKTAKSSIANCCRGLTRTAFGYKWKFTNQGPSESQDSLQTAHMLEHLEDTDTKV